MTSRTPIADLLGLPPVHDRTILTIAGRRYEYYPPGRDGTAEGLYRADAGYGVSNPCFCLVPWSAPAHHAMTLGQYLAGRPGVKRAEAEAITAAARAELA